MSGCDLSIQFKHELVNGMKPKEIFCGDEVIHEQLEGE